jgi:hypothetical protein
LLIECGDADEVRKAGSSNLETLNIHVLAAVPG